MWMDQQLQIQAIPIFLAHSPMDWATRSTTISSARNSIAASVYIIRGNNLKGAGVGEGDVCLNFGVCPRNKWSCCNSYQLEFKTVTTNCLSQTWGYTSLNDNWSTIKNRNWKFIEKDKIKKASVNIMRKKSKWNFKKKNKKARSNKKTSVNNNLRGKPKWNFKKSRKESRVYHAGMIIE